MKKYIRRFINILLVSGILIILFGANKTFPNSPTIGSFPIAIPNPEPAIEVTEESEWVIWTLDPHRQIHVACGKKGNGIDLFNCYPTVTVNGEPVIDTAHLNLDIKVDVINYKPMNPEKLATASAAFKAVKERNFELLPESTKDSTKIYFEERPWKNFREYVRYWYSHTKKGKGLFPLVERYDFIPLQTVLSKNWTETKGGLSGVGRRGAEFGIMGEGLKGRDEKHYLDPNVEYQAYSTRYLMYLDFYQLLAGETRANGKKSNLYINRYKRWKKLGYADDKAWAYAFQVDTDTRRKAKENKLLVYSKKRGWENTTDALSYAQCGCYYKPKEQVSCYKKRLAHSATIFKLSVVAKAYMNEFDEELAEENTLIAQNKK